MPNKIFDAWEKIFGALNLDATQDQHIITAKQIKEIGGCEPRLMAKMDSSEDVPPIMKRHGYFLLPVSRSTYTIIRGDGFHRLEANQKQATEFVSQIKFNLVTNGRNTSEMQYLDYCSNAGLIEEVIGRGKLYPMIRGREGSGEHLFTVSDNQVELKNAQIEVDLGLEGQDSIVLLEAKSKTPQDFIIRQLYYPYKKFSTNYINKQVSPIFFTYDQGQETYNFWKYRFEDPTDYNSISLIGCDSYLIREENTVQLSDIADQNLIIGAQKNIIPQANDLDKVQRLIYLVSQGVTSAIEIAKSFDFAPRQSSYYREAAEALGFVSFNGREYSLTDAGQLLVSLDTEHRNILFAKAVNEFELFKQCISILQSKGSLSRHDIESIITINSTLSGSTIPRRAASIESWLKWVASKTGTFSFEAGRFTVV